MATAILYPASDQGGSGPPGGLKNEAGNSSPLYPSIDEGTASPNDSDFVESLGGGTGSGNFIYHFGLSTPPSNVSVVTAVSIAVRLMNSGSKGDVQDWIALRLYQSDKTTALIASQTITDSNSIATYTFNPAITGATTKAAWTGATLALTLNVGTLAGARLYAAQVTITYTPGASAGLLSRRRRFMMEG